MKSKWKILIRVAIAIAMVALLLAGLRHRGKAAVEAYRKQLVAQGEKMTIAELDPRPSVEQQTAAQELMAAMGPFNSMPTNYPSPTKTVALGHVLVPWAEERYPNEDSSNVWPAVNAQLLAHQHDLASLRSVLENPAGVGSFDLDYSQGFSMSWAHLPPTKNAAVWLSIAVIDEFHEGHPANAWENLKCCLASTRVLEREPTMISQLVRAAIGQIALGATWQALQYPGWQDRDLADMQATWESLNFLDELEPSIQMDRVMTSQSFASSRKSSTSYESLFGMAGGSPWDDLRELFSNPKDGYEALMNKYPRFWEWKLRWSYDEELSNMQTRQAALKAVRQIRTDEAAVPALKQLEKEGAKISMLYTNTSQLFLFGGATDASSEYAFLLKMAYMETERRMLVTAIALKRYQLREGKYPEQLQDLVPGYIKKLPVDLMDGKPLRYHSKLDGTFLLYSVGKDGEDNGGDFTPAADGPKNWWLGRDMVWPMPATREETRAYEQKMVAEWLAKHPKSTVGK